MPAPDYGKPRPLRWLGTVIPDYRAWRLICWLGWCPCRLYDDGDGIGGQCIKCGKVVGYMTNAELQACVHGLREPWEPRVGTLDDG